MNEDDYIDLDKFCDALLDKEDGHAKYTSPFRIAKAGIVVLYIAFTEKQRAGILTDSDDFIAYVRMQAINLIANGKMYVTNVTGREHNTNG